jgi:hypothetical protein
MPYICEFVGNYPFALIGGGLILSLIVARIISDKASRINAAKWRE